MDNKNLMLAFSKDRPLQLDLMLSSLKARCGDIDKLGLKVIACTSNDNFLEGYNILEQEHPDVEFIPEKDFQMDVIRAVQDYDYVLWSVDDTIYTNDFFIEPITKILDSRDYILGCSLRLGKNTNFCYPMNTSQRIPGMINFENMKMYIWSTSELDFRYAMEISSSIYNVKDIFPTLNNYDFTNPNLLESVLDYYGLGNFVCRKPNMLCFENSVAFSNPVNVVSNHGNRAGNKEKYSTTNMLKKYMNGFRINPEKFHGFVPSSCHQEVDLF
jgi:hypothetical protein